MLKIREQNPEEKVVILSMNAINPAKQAEAEAKRYNIPFDVVICRGAGVIRDYEVTKLPQVFIIDDKGVIQASELFMQADQMKGVLDKLLTPTR